MIANVIVPRPLDEPLSYLIPEEFSHLVKVGSFVIVPFRSKKIEGFVVDVLPEPKDISYKLKSILEVPTETLVFTEKDLVFFKWIANYYQLPLGEVFNSAFPKAVFKFTKKKTKSALNSDIKTKPSTLKLTQDQSLALKSISESLSKNIYDPFLLWGITGSGKTEVYLTAAEQALNENKTVLILVPEISLTPQLRSRFEDRFGNNVAVLHSGLTDKMRREYWWKIRNKEFHVVVGARSALFAPLENIGLIIVDEEHEGSYKQEDHLRYNARDLALVRAKQHNAIAILGSATPTIETFYSAQQNKYKLLTLKTRPGTSRLPVIEVVDLRHEPKADQLLHKSKLKVFSKRMINGILETLEKKEQGILFINRKGYANFTLCEDCGHVPECLNCSVSLTLYLKNNQFKCHYCDYKIPIPKSCSKCNSTEIKQMGLGSELIEDCLRIIAPTARVQRIDTDTIESFKDLEKHLTDFREQKLDFLVGTQMIAKGHDFPNVTFVGIVLADTNLHLPQFRASEKTFQLLSQVSGRAGRADKPGKVILQTYLPEHYVITCATNHDYIKFYEKEIEFRKDFSYPPFKRIAQIEFRHLKEERASADAYSAAKLLGHLNVNNPEHIVEILGPSQAVIAKVANQFRWQILLKAEKFSDLNAVIKTLRKNGVRFIDVDPVNTL